MLTRKEFYQYLIKQGCVVGEFEGINRTARQIEILNRKKGTYFYIATPIDDTLVPSRIVENACTRLGISLPLNY